MLQIAAHPCVPRIEAGLAGLTEEQIAVARVKAAEQGISLQASVLRLGIVTEAELLQAAAQKAGREFVTAIGEHVDPEALRAVTANVASHYHVMPVALREGRLILATCDPFAADLEHEIGLVLGDSREISLVVAASTIIGKAIRTFYGVGAATVEQMISAEDKHDNAAAKHDLMDEDKAREASVLKLVNQLLADGITNNVTDIHIEPYESDLKVRYRVDGMLYDAGVPSTVRHFREGITSRIKILSGLDIAEKRLPQDGRAQVDVSGRRYDLRVSVLPTRYGEAINIRILAQTTLIPDLASLGMSPLEVHALGRLIYKPHGIILATGPTGSGKTTTLYTCMHLLKDTNSKIITIEDPIEYDMPGIVQMQVAPGIGFTFARALRSMLRHDPDIMLVGEIRDLETAETAIRTALTGHLVFSTLHTNDAAGAIARLLDMGIEPYLLASSIEAVLAQRLVRMICPECKQAAELDPEVATAIKSLTQQEQVPPVFKGRGCSKCRFTGYRGRTVITELLLLSDTIREMTVAKRHANEIDAQARREGMTCLLQSGLAKAFAGITTCEEVLRATTGSIL